MTKTIYIGADHAGYRLKETTKDILKTKGYEVIDIGATSLVFEDDYTDFAHAVTKHVMEDAHSFGILFCDTGSGMCIAANKTKGIRAVNAWNPSIAHDARADNDANVLCIAQKMVSEGLLEDIINMWLATPFSQEERHARRIQKIEQ